VNKHVSVCGKCGSPRLLRDAYVAVNNPDDVRTFDNTVCEDCDYDGHDVRVVEVDEDFDIYVDTYPLKKE